MKLIAAIVSASMFSLAICGSFGASGGTRNRTLTDPDPMREPNRFAWKVFSEICRPHIGPGNNNADWETWADEDLVFGHPEKKPQWPNPSGERLRFYTSVQSHPDLASARLPNDSTGQASPRAKATPAQLKRQRIEPSGDSLSLSAGSPALKTLKRPLIEPSGDSVEARMNEPTFRYIVDNQLYYVEGLIARYKTDKDLNFPKPSKEIKAEWLPIDESDKPRYHWNYDRSGKLYGLVALHITTKDIPNWFWATFEHVDKYRLGNDLPYKDTFGFKGDTMNPKLKRMFKAAGLGAEWSNYRLVGTETTFYDRHHKPNRCGNALIEGNPSSNVLSTSSCMSCHQQSTTASKGGFILPFYGLTPPAGLLGSYDTDQLKGMDGKRMFIKRDFVWSFINAKPRNSSANSSSATH